MVNGAPVHSNYSISYANGAKLDIEYSGGRYYFYFTPGTTYIASQDLTADPTTPIRNTNGDSVYVQGGTAEYYWILTVHVTPAPAPSVASISPTDGPPRGGTIVTITGANFTGATAVRFGTVEGGIIGVSDTLISAASPAGTGVVDVTVTGPGGTSATSNADRFTYATAPVASSFTAAAVAYNDGGAGQTSINVSGNVTNDPTTYALGSTSTPNGGRATISSAGVVSYTPPIGYRGNDSFTFTASNGGGTSDPATVTVPVSDPTFAISLSSTSGTVGVPLSGVNVTTTGGEPIYSCTTNPLSGPLPAGISLTANCMLTGTPTTAGVTSFSVVVTDNTRGIGPVTQISGTFNFTVNATLPGAPTAVQASTSVASESATTGSAVVTFTPPTDTGGGISRYTVTSAPGGFTAQGTGAPITVTGLAFGTAYTFKVIAENSAGPGAASVASSAITPTKAQTIRFSNPGTQNFGSTTPLAATATSGLAVAFASQTTNICDIVSSNQVRAKAPGTCTIQANQSGSAVYATATAVNQSFQIVIPGGVPSIATTTLPAPTRGVAYSQQIRATGGAPAYTFSFTGTLPTGLLLNNSSGILSGVVTAAGTYNFRVTVADQAGQQAFRDYSLTVISPSFTFTPMALPVGKVGVAYPTTAVVASAGIAPYAYAVTTGPLPAGLALSPAGVLSGTPMTAGTYPVTITATDNFGVKGAQAYSIAIGEAAPVVSNDIAKVGFGEATTIRVTSNDSGAITSLAVDRRPSHGSVTIDGLNAIYTPASGYYGPDTFTYTANGPGGTSNVATVSVTVATPAAPTVADKSDVSVAYNSTGTVINLSGAITGVHSSIALASGPAHGTISISGDTVTYVPTSGYYGPDNFTYTATGPGGTSAPATVNLTVATPAIPTVAGKSGVAVAYNSTGTVIDLSGVITGVHSSIAIASPPTHGITRISGDTVTYTPAPGYYGADSFTYTATGPGGTSASATVSLTVVTPAAPTVAGKSGVAVAYNSAGTAVDLSGAITGVHSSIALASGPAHGTTSVSGDTITYTPAPGYYGADSFTYTATGPGGTSPPARVSLTVVTPAVPTVAGRSGIAIAYNSTGTAIDLSGLVSGVHSSIAASAPLHGTVSVAGDAVTYIPTAGYYGADSFTYTATGPGGTSAPATISLTVATPAIPTVAGKSGVIVTYNSSGTAIDLSGSITGIHSSIAASAPAHGTVSVAGDVVTYVPTSGYYGADSFTYTATGPGGTSSAATVRVTVATPAAPTVANKAGVAVMYSSTGIAIDLSSSVSGVHTSIAASAPTHGTVSVAGDTVTYIPTAGYYGVDSFTYTATGPGGTSAPAKVSLTVAPPAAPIVAGKSGIAVAYNSTGTAIDLLGSVSGVHSSIAASAPAHGTVSISGDTVTYTPTTGYYGADSFTYTATGPGGTSTPGTVSLIVATPAIPIVAGKSGVAVAYNTAALIDLSGSITGVHSSISASVPPHGTVSVAGDVATYTPTTGYYGIDSFTYTATGPGGTSAPAKVSVTVATPAVPNVAGKSGVTVAYNSTGTSIDLSGAIIGVHSSIAIATPPAHGTTSISGDTVTYTPTTGYYGADGFSYTATGPGGTSAPAKVSVTVATPAVPNVAGKSGVTVAYNSTGTSIDLSGAIIGVHSSIAIATPPAHGTTSISGDTVTYTPTTGYYGADGFSYTATGPGGTSAPAKVSLTIATPPAPIVKSGSGSVASSTQTQKSVDINLSALVTGDYTGIELAGTPAHGTVALRDTPGSLSAGARGGPTVVATYSPTSGFSGTDTFNFIAVGPGGRSAPATITVTVTGTVPTVAAKTARAIDNQLVSVELTDGATEGPFIDATIVSVSPADKATAKIVESGSTSARTYRLDVTLAPHFGGEVVVAYTLSNQFGTSAPATVTIAVTARPDPSLDPNVRALSDAEAESTREFAQTQSRNFLERAEQLHNGGGSGKTHMGISLGLTDMTSAGLPVYGSDQREQQDVADRSRDDVDDANAGDRRMTVSDGKAAGSDGKDGGDGERRKGSISIWSGGQIGIGTRDQTTDRAKISVTSGGLSAGADIKLSEAATVGVGGGAGFDSSEIGGQAASLNGASSVVATYGSFAPVNNMFVDVVVGYGDLSFKSRRAIDGTTASGSRNGTMWFGAASSGIDRNDGGLHWSLYGRGEWLNGTLGAYAEGGAGIMDLRFDKRDVSSLTGVLGGRFELDEPLVIGMFRPRIRVEWSHEFQDSSVQMLDYADISGNALYGIRTEGWNRDEYEVALGGGLNIPSRWMLDFELGLRGASGERDGSLTIKLSKEF
jgi:hypothetical protein